MKIIIKIRFMRLSTLIMWLLFPALQINSGSSEYKWSL